MLKIGDFSRLAQVSVKTLRYYGELGLLEPAWIDRYTGYRYYALGQLPQLNRILALKDLGFSLEQIRQLLHDDLPAAELRGMMRLKYAEIERLVQAEQARLARVAGRLRQIEQEGDLPAYDVVLKAVPPQRVAGIRDVVPTYEGTQSLFDELTGRLSTHRIEAVPGCQGIALFYDREYRERGIDVEAAVPVAGTLPTLPRVTVHDLPGCESVASAVHQGRYETLPAAYQTLIEWVEANGYTSVAPNRDVYLRGPGSNVPPEEYITEIQFPVERKHLSYLMAQHKERDKMEPKIVTKPAFTVVGMKYHGKNENDEIAQMWAEFNPRIPEIKHQSGPAYGVCGNMEEDSSFEYVAGMEVSSTEGLPEGMTYWDVPEQTYAVFPCTLRTIHAAYEYAFQTWLPGSGYARGEGPDFELYEEEFDPEVEDPKLAIYVPIK
ncbi:MAG: GyrI-like domain-containing protein [Anaerolineae bacterium]|nr:GyrI-like domain-containing protein [Anaerolineae bacterium]